MTNSTTNKLQLASGTQHRVVGHLHCPFCGSLNLDVHEPCHIAAANAELQALTSAHPQQRHGVHGTREAMRIV